MKESKSELSLLEHMTRNYVPQYRVPGKLHFNGFKKDVSHRVAETPV